MRAHHVGVGSESVGGTASAVAVGIVVGSDIVTGVKGGHHGVLVAFKGVVFRAEVVVAFVGIAVVFFFCPFKMQQFLTFVWPI